MTHVHETSTSFLQLILMQVH